MISWLQTVIQRNHKVLFSLLLIVLIVAFVFTIGDFGGVGPGSRADRMAAQQFYGYDLSNRRTQEDLANWTNVSLFLSKQPQPTNQEQYTALVLQRVIGLYLADQFQIPDTPSKTEFSSFFQSVPAFADPQTGAYSPNRSQEIIDDFNNNPQLGDAVLTLVLVQDYRIAKALELVGGPGYVLPQLAEVSVQGRKTQWTLEVAKLSRAETKPQIDLSDAAIESYYQASKERYKPENEVVASYVFIPADIAAVAEPRKAQLETFYQDHSAEWPKGEDGQPKPLADIREQVVAAWKQHTASENAENAANQLTLAVYNAAASGSIQPDAQSVAAFLAKDGMKLIDLPAFNSAELSRQDVQQPLIKQRVLGLRGQDRFFSDAIPVDNGAAVAFLFDERQLPIPPLADIREQVVADYTAEQNLRFFAEKTQSDQQALQAALAEGKLFEEAAKALGLTVQKIPSFTLETLPQDINPYLLFAAMDLQQGQISQPLSDAEGSSFVYVAERKLPQGEINAEELEQSVSWLQPMFQRATISSVLSQMLNIGEEQEAQAAGY